MTHTVIPATGKTKKREKDRKGRIMREYVQLLELLILLRTGGHGVRMGGSIIGSSSVRLNGTDLKRYEKIGWSNDNPSR